MAGCQYSDFLFEQIIIGIDNQLFMLNQNIGYRSHIAHEYRSMISPYALFISVTVINTWHDIRADTCQVQKLNWSYPNIKGISDALLLYKHMD